MESQKRWTQQLNTTALGTHLYLLCIGHLLGPAAAARSLQSCPTLCDPIDGSPPGSPFPGILPARTLEWVAISFSNACKWEVKVKSLSCVRLSATPWSAAHQAPPSMGLSRQEDWSGAPWPSPLLGPRAWQTKYDFVGTQPCLLIYYYLWLLSPGFAPCISSMLEEAYTLVGVIRDTGSVLGLGRSPGRGHGYPLRYCCIKNPMDRGAWWATVHGVSKNWTWLKLISMHAHTHTEGRQSPWQGCSPLYKLIPPPTGLDPRRSCGPLQQRVSYSGVTFLFLLLRTEISMGFGV